MTKMQQLRVLLLDDEASLREPLKDHLANNFGYHVDAVGTGKEALALVEQTEGHYDVALLDLLLLEDTTDGIGIMEEIKARYPGVEIIIMTGWGPDHRQRALRAGAFRYVEKPFDVEELATLIRTAAQQVRLRSIGRAILTEHDLDRTLESIANAACSLALADEAAISLLDQAAGVPPGRFRTYPDQKQWRRHFAERELSREIIQAGRVERVLDTLEDSRVDRQVIDASIRSFLGMPIPGEEGNLGVLYVYSRTSGRFEEGATVAVLQTLAWQAGLAIVNAQAFQNVQAHARHMEALVLTGQGLTRATSLEEQLAIAWEFTQKQLEITTFFVALYNGQEDELSFPLFYDKGEQVSLDTRILGDDPEEWGITGWVVKRGKEWFSPTQEDLRQKCEQVGIGPILVGDHYQSCFYFPLRIGQEVFGAISIQSYEPYAFSEILLNACRALGSQLAVAIENARLFAKLTETTELLNALVESSFDAVIAIDQSNKIKVFNRQSEEMFGWAAQEMYGGNVTRLWVDVDEAAKIYEELAQGRPVSARPVELINHDREHFPALISAAQLQDASGSHIGQVGFIRDLRKVQILEDRLHALVEVGRVITSTLDLDTVLTLITKSFKMASPAAQHGTIHLYDPQDGILHLSASTREYSDEVRELLSFKVGEGIGGRVFQSQQSFRVPDVAKDPCSKPIDHPEVEEHRAMICVPLRAGEQMLGTLSLSSFEDVSTFNDEDLELLSSFGSQVAVAIQNAQQHEELRRVKGLIGARTALAWMGMASAAWQHGIRGHAVTIRDQIELLRRDLDRSLPQERRAAVGGRLSRIEGLATKILEKPITPPLSADEGVTFVAVDDLVGERTRRLWEHDPYRQVELELSLGLGDAVTVRASPEWLRQAFDFLVDNAVEVVVGCPEQRVTIGTRRAEGEVEIFVTNTGPEFPEELRSKAGREPIEESEGAKGLGMGLLMARTIAQTYGGDMQMESTSPEGTTWVIWLPRAQ